MRRHIMKLKVNGNQIVVETIPEPPAGYAVKVWQGVDGERQHMLADDIAPSTEEAAKLFAQQCRKYVDELCEIPTMGVPMNYRPRVRIEEED